MCYALAVYDPGAKYGGAANPRWRRAASGIQVAKKRAPAGQRNDDFESFIDKNKTIWQNGLISNKNLINLDKITLQPGI